MSAFMVNKRLKDSKVSFDERRLRNIVDRWQLCDDRQAIYLRAGRAGVGQTTRHVRTQILNDKQTLQKCGLCHPLNRPILIRIGKAASTCSGSGLLIGNTGFEHVTSRVFVATCSRGWESVRVQAYSLF